MQIGKWIAFGLAAIIGLAGSKSADTIRREKESNFTIAVIQGDAQTVSRLLGEGVDVHIVGKAGLATAASLGHVEVVRLLLDRGVDPNEELLSGKTALTEVLGNSPCSAEKTETINLLLDRHADVNAHGEGNVTAIELAAQNCDLQILQRLLHTIADPNQFGKKSALENAASRHDLRMVSDLLAAGADPNRFGETSALAAILAVPRDGNKDDLAIVRLLLKYKADPNTALLGTSVARIAKSGVADAMIYKALIDAGAKPPEATNAEIQAAKDSEALREEIRDKYGTPEISALNSSLGSLKRKFGEPSKSCLDCPAENESSFEWFRGKLTATFFTPNSRSVTESQVPIEVCILDPFPGSIGGMGTGRTFVPGEAWTCLDTSGTKPCPRDFEGHAYSKPLGNHYALNVTTARITGRVTQLCHVDNRYTINMKRIDPLRQ
jgi:ankyrin repeat protein